MDNGKEPIGLIKHVKLVILVLIHLLLLLLYVLLLLLFVPIQLPIVGCIRMDLGDWFEEHKLEHNLEALLMAYKDLCNQLEHKDYR